LPGVDGVVQSSVYLGTSTQIIVDLPGAVTMTVLVPNASEAERARLPGGGAPVRLSWESDHMHVVRESEARLANVEETILA
jgi:ABC-type Fe3+/spermidine/putrescine transport system ATPase subunit